MRQKDVTLDLTGCRNILEMHRRIKETFSFPDYYGENWHAFKDAFITVGIPERIEVVGADSLPQSLMKDVELMIEAMEGIKKELNHYGVRFEYEIIS